MKQTIFVFAIVGLALASQGQSIYNNNAASIVSQTGSYWVISGGGITLNSESAVNPTTFYNLTIKDAALLSLAPTTCLTVSGTLTNSATPAIDGAGLVIKSDASGTGSLMITGSTAASGTAERYMTPSTWHIVAAPAIETLGGTGGFLDRNLDIPHLTGVSYDGTQLGMMDFNTGENKWNGYFITGTGGSFTSGKGYMVRTVPPDPVAPTILNFKGTLTAGNTNVTVTSGWNCIGNPFTTAILISNGANSFLTVNGVTKLESTIDPSHYGVYYWDDASKAYNVINEASADPSYAQSGQGFFVKAKTGLITEGDGKNDFVSFTPAMQVHLNTLEFKATTLPYPSIKLLASSNGTTVSTDIKFIDGTTNGLDRGYDAGILKAGGTFSVYTKLVEDNGIEFQLQCLPSSGYDKMVIPVGIDSKSAGEIVFSVQTVQLDPSCKAILEDKLTNTYTDLSKNSYKAAVAANTAGTGRFYLHTGDIVSGIEDQVLQGKLTAYAKGNKEIRVLGEIGDGAIATLYNGLGKVVLTKKLGAGSLNIIGLVNLSSGVYLLNINNKGMSQTIKIMIRK